MRIKAPTFTALLIIVSMTLLSPVIHSAIQLDKNDNRLTYNQASTSPKTSGVKGDTVLVNGARAIGIYWDKTTKWNASEGTGLLTTTTSRTDGRFNNTIIIPPTQNGIHMILAVDTSTGETTSTTFTVKQKTEPSATNLAPGDELELRGYGFTTNARLVSIEIVND